MKQKTNKKRRYAKPEIKSVKIDSQISMVMQTDTPPGDPGAENLNQDEVHNPYKITNA
jgi:hypothetical protein